MDCIKTGELILKLRKEKNMTQQEVAKAMNISNKTVSKWERGLGCPDVSLLGELSNIFGINIDKLLCGELVANEVNGGNMKRVKFYVCSECKNVITASGEADISCCGRKLAALVSAEVDAAHKMKVEEIENDYYITMNHEMTKNHFISFVAYVAMDRVMLIKLYPEQDAEVRFPKIRGGKIYAYCSNHGLWKL